MLQEESLIKSDTHKHSMSASKRRLSKGGKAANLPIQEEELTIDEDLHVQSNSRRNSFARRRQSVDHAATVEESEESIQDQNRIADMYKSIIKMSSENKINAKNSWNLDLINHMDKMIKSDENSQRNGAKGVNFQKASCTLDASIKIYSHRVDDTWSSSYRILENLSRSELIEEDDMDDDDDDADDEGRKQKKASRVGSKSTSRKHNLIKTIEKKMENINFTVQENCHAADPMFHKMSQAFDEGGAKGMLMSNLRVSPKSSTIMFSALGQDSLVKDSDVQEVDTTENVDKVADSKDGVISGKAPTCVTLDVAKDNLNLLAASKSLLARSGFQIDDLLAKSVCSSLNLYRDALDISPGNQLRYLDFAPLHRLQSSDPVDGVEVPQDEGDYCDGGGACDLYDGNDDDDDDHEESAYFGESVPLTADALASLGQSSGRRTSGSSDDMSIYSSTSKIQWDAVYEDNDDSNSVCSNQMASDSGSGVLSVNDTNPIGFQSSKQNAASTAAFLAMHTGATNQWAGAKHWRRSTRQKSANKTLDESEAVTKKTPKSRAKKEKFVFDFSKVGEGVSEQINSKFEKSKGSKKLDPTVLSDAVVQKGTVQAQEGVYTLPADARLNTKDLCRLFHWSSMIVPPANTIDDITKAICAPSALSHRYVGVSGDQLLRTQNGKRRMSGGSAVDTIWVAPSNQPCDDTESFDNSPGDYYDDDDDDNDNHYQSDFVDENTVPNMINAQRGKSNGLEIEVEGGLLEAPRKVNKLEIGYAQSSKRVNVKKLKTDLWTKLESDCSGEVNENHSSGPEGKELSFQDVVCDIAQDQTQKDASLSFYFICLLHLANEKNLCIKDSATMDDLMISKGSTH